MKISLAVLLLLGCISVHAEPADDVECIKCIDTSDIAAGAVAGSKLQDDTVTKNKLKNQAVVTSKLGSQAVSSSKIKNGAVTYGKLSPDLKTTIDEFKAHIGGGPDDPYSEDIDVVQQSAIPGEVVDVNGELLEVASLPFTRLDTDEAYVLEYVTDASQLGFDVQLFQAAPFTEEPGSPYVAGTYNFSINGYPAQLTQSYALRQFSTGAPSGLPPPVVFFVDRIRIIIGDNTGISLQLTYMDPDIGGNTRANRNSFLKSRLNFLPYLEVRPET